MSLTSGHTDNNRPSRQASVHVPPVIHNLFIVFAVIKYDIRLDKKAVIRNTNFGLLYFII